MEQSQREAYLKKKQQEKFLLHSDPGRESDQKYMKL